LHCNHLPGSPDIVFPGRRIAVFINGCFWHGHKACKFFVVPKTRTEWWLNKINTNTENDEKNTQLLRDTGWKVITVFECELNNDRVNGTLNQLLHELH